MKSDCSSPHTLSAPAPRTRILNTNRTVSQIFPTTVECAWTLSSSLPRKSQSPIFKLIEFLKEKTLSLIGQSSSAAIYMQWCSFVFTYFKQALFYGFRKYCVCHQVRRQTRCFSMTYMGTKVFVLKTQNIDSDSSNTLSSLQLCWCFFVFCIRMNCEILRDIHFRPHYIYFLFLKVNLFFPLKWCCW